MHVKFGLGYQVNNEHHHLYCMVELRLTLRALLTKGRRFISAFVVVDCTQRGCRKRVPSLRFQWPKKKKMKQSKREGERGVKESKEREGAMSATSHRLSTVVERRGRGDTPKRRVSKR